MVFLSLAVAVQSHFYDLHIPLLSLGVMIAVKLWAVQSDIMPHALPKAQRSIPSKAAPSNRLDA
jgi:hypothetical protein